MGVYSCLRDILLVSGQFLASGTQAGPSSEGRSLADLDLAKVRIPECPEGFPFGFDLAAAELGIAGDKARKHYFAKESKLLLESKQSQCMSALPVAEVESEETRLLSCQRCGVGSDCMLSSSTKLPSQGKSGAESGAADPLESESPHE